MPTLFYSSFLTFLLIFLCGLAICRPQAGNVGPDVPIGQQQPNQQQMNKENAVVGEIGEKMRQEAMPMERPRRTIGQGIDEGVEQAKETGQNISQSNKTYPICLSTYFYSLNRRYNWPKNPGNW
jgi:hypothetical protein